MLRRLAFAYSLLAYASFGFSLFWLLAFLVDAALLPVTVNSGPTASGWLAAGLDLALIAAFGLQHSVMARPGFKRWWVRLVPQAIERSTYVLISSAVTILLCWWWQPLPEMIWSVESTLARTLCWAGFVIGLGVLVGASFHIDHFELLGLRQTWGALRGRRLVSPPFMIRGLYRLVRHPIYVGWLLLFWCTPHMSIGHLLLASGMTLYALIAIIFEERDLVSTIGDQYVAYRKAVPALLPRRHSAGNINGGSVVALALLLAAAADISHASEWTEHVALESDGRMREALIYSPTPDFVPHRLVVMLHGAGGDASRIRHVTAHGLERNAAAAGWIVAYPQGIGGTWDDCRRTPDYPAKRQQIDDVAFLVELIERLRERYAIATEDVLVAGFSNGGQMALRLGLERPGAIGGVAIVAAQLPTPAESLCHGKLSGINVLLVGGTRDPLIPFAGGASMGPTGDSLGEVLSLHETARAFAAALGHDSPTRTVCLPEADDQDDTSAELTEWRVPDRPVLRLYTLHGAGHIVPQREVELPAIVGRSAGDIDFGDVVAEFVEAWPRRLASERP